MKINFNIKPNFLNINLTNQKNNLPFRGLDNFYENDSFSNEVKNIPTEQVIEESIKEVQKNQKTSINRNSVFSSIGKAFENNNLLEEAKKIYNYSYKNQINENESSQALKDALMDLDRINEKINAAKSLDVRG